MMTVPLGGRIAAGRVARVDDGDYELVMRYHWHVHEAARKGRPTGPYARAKPGRGSGGFFMHTLITGWPRVDHKDHDGLNNQRYNLRPATNSLNMANKRPRIVASSAYKGVERRKNRWIASIRVDGHLSYLGSFDDEADAARASDAAAAVTWGGYAYLNFPHDHR